jgi:hypothetical protein
MVTGGRVRVRRKKPAAGAGESGKRGAGIEIDAEERRHLIEACAFFRADHFRPAEPGSCREQDLKDAAAEIDAVLKRRAGKGRKR